MSLPPWTVRRVFLVAGVFFLGISITMWLSMFITDMVGLSNLLTDTLLP